MEYCLIPTDIAPEEDRSYPSPIAQLLWRIEDLETRLSELREKSEDTSDFSRISEKEIEYISPKYFSNATDIITAIEIARQKIFLLLAKEASQEHTSSFIQLELSELLSVA